MDFTPHSLDQRKLAVIETAEKNSHEEWKAQRFLKQSQGNRELQIPHQPFLLQGSSEDKLQQLLGRDKAVSLVFYLAPEFC